MLNSNLVQFIISYCLSFEASLFALDFLGNFHLFYFLRLKMQNNSEFLKCQHCERFFFTKTGFKNHNNKEHYKEEGSLVVSKEEKSFNFEIDYFSQKSGNFRNKNEFEMIQIGHDEESSEKSPDFEGIKIKSLTSKHLNDKTENENEFSRLEGDQSTTLIEHSSTNDPKNLTKIEKDQIQGNNLRIDSKSLADIGEFKIIEHNSTKMATQRVISPSTATNKTIKPNLQKKTQNQEIQKERKHKCHLCKKAFSRERDMKHHIAVVHKKLRPFKCNLCDKQFSKEGTVKIHIATVHKKLKAYKCHLCEKNFSQEGSVKLHIEAIHEKLKSYQCNLCEKEFTREDHCKKHIAAVHKKLKPYKCPLCDKKFSQEYYVKIHIDAVQKKLKAYKCHLCEKNFAQEHCVKNHIVAVHEKLKPYNFHLCEKSFGYQNNFKCHIPTAHKILKA